MTESTCFETVWPARAYQRTDPVNFRVDATMSEVVSECRGRLCYLATPYSKMVLDDAGRWSREKSITAAILAGRWVRDFALDGVTALSPIALCCAALDADHVTGYLDPLDAVFWENWCRPMLNASGAVIVPPLPGWQESVGIGVEVRAALQIGLPVYVMGPVE
ncbi:DUF1937 family protein [Roseovarius sp. MMSF_3350]|uniref:DUF1937 family protein n=1 Tax=Roseovarius sp. MMSF_3350 TaxID=3046706 RepID=UPI00273D71F2|nr:DUF1937 family protein [Roseovarius sp. MMSF_3350]